MSQPRTEQLAQKLPLPESDTWVRLFESNADWTLKQDFLARGLVDLDASPDRATQILDACVRRHADTPTSRLSGGTDAPLVLPSTMSGPWPAPSGSEDGEALLLARLVALGGLPFATPERPGPDLLDVALRKRWRGVVLQVLRRSDVPDAHDLQGRRSDLKFGKKPLPWAHSLAFLDRTDELKAWLSLPGMDVNAVDDQGKTPLFYARTPRVVALLCACGVDPGWVAPDGRNAPSQWENPPTPYRGFMDPATLQGLKAALPDACETHPDSLIGRVHRWASVGPEKWTQLSALVQNELHQLRLPVANRGAAEGAEVEWGMVGFLGLQLSINHFSNAYGQERRLKWEEFAHSLPQALLDHESVPGVPDGWVLLAALYHQTSASYVPPVPQRKGSTGQTLVNLWASRLLKGEAKVERVRHWCLSMLKAAGVLLEQFGMDDPRNFAALVWDTVETVDVRMANKVDGCRAPSLKRELWALLVCTPMFRRVLVSDRGLMASMLAEGLELPWADVSPTALWAGLLGLYNETSRREQKGYTRGTEALERIMLSWLKQQYLPTCIQESKVRGGLATLARRQPDVRSALLAIRLEKAVKEAPVTTGRLRTRM